MINVSSAFKEALSNDNRAYIERVVITLENETVLELGNAKLWGGGYEVDDAVSSDNSFSAIGSAIVNSAKLVINNIYDDYSDYVFENAKVVLYIGMELENSGQKIIESFKKGTYIVDGAQYNGSIITLSLLDNMYFFDRPYNESTLVYPASCDTIIRDACTICGINLASTTFPNRDTVIAERPTDEAITFREVIAYVAQICGCYARCNTDGNLELKWFDTDSLEDQSASVYHIDSIYKSDVSMDDVVITGVRATYNVTIDGKEQTLTYLTGSEGYVIEISKNPMITGLTVQDIVNRLGVQLIGLRFRKASVSHSSDPTLEAGDVAILDDRKGNSYPILVTRTRFKVGSSQNTVCGAENPARKSAARYSEETKNYVELRKKINYQKDAFDAAIEDLSERIDAADGMFTTQETTPGGGTITYLHNKPLLSESDIQIMISSVGVTVTSNGTDPNPTWYGLTVDGTLISNILNTVGINASWINTGQLVITKNGTEVFFADVDTGTVRISGNSISITAGDPISSAISTAQSAAATYTDQQIATYADQVEGELDVIRDQLDGVVYTYYYDYAPTTSNYPASEWTTEALRSDHEGDLFLDTSTGRSYRWLKENNVWKWKEIPDTASAQALQLAQQAMDTADGKRRVFVSTPYPPYDVGDIWMDSSSGEIMTCTTARTSGSQYVSTDFEKLNDYGEDNAIHLETPFEWSSNGQTANFTAVIYKGEDDVTSDYPDAWFVWTLRTENGETQIATGKTCSVSKSALGYGGTVTCTFTTYETATLATRSLKALNTRSGLTLTTYVATEGTQPVTELPYKTAAQVNLSDYLMGIDAADGYQVSVENFGLKLRDAIYDPRYVLKAGDTMTGQLILHYTNPALMEKGTISMRIGAETLSSNQRIGALFQQDSNGDVCFYSETYRTTDNITYTSFVHRRYSADGSTAYYNGFSLDILNDGTRRVRFSDNTVRDAWANGLNVVKKAGDTMSGNLTLSKDTPNLIAKHTGVNAANADNGRSATTWYGMPIRDNADRTVSAFYGFAQPDGVIGAGLWVYAHNTSGAQTGAGALRIFINKSGTIGYSVDNPAAFRSAIGAINRAGDTMTANFTLSAADTTGRWYKVKNSKHEGSFYVDSSGNLGIWSDTKRKWIVRSDASGNVYLNNHNLTNGIKGWTQIAQVTGTNSATYSLSGYTECLLMIWHGTNYLGTAVFPTIAIGSTQYEIYTGGWGNHNTASNRAACAKVSNTKLTGVMVRVDNSDVASSSYFRLYAR